MGYIQSFATILVPKDMGVYLFNCSLFRECHQLGGWMEVVINLEVLDNQWEDSFLGTVTRTQRFGVFTMQRTRRELDLSSG